MYQNIDVYLWSQMYFSWKYLNFSSFLQGESQEQNWNQWLTQATWNKQNSRQRLLLSVQVLGFNPERAVPCGTPKQTVDTFKMLELLEVPEAYEKLNLIITQENSSNWIQLFLRLLRIIFRAKSLGITTSSHIPGQLPARPRQTP